MSLISYQSVLINVGEPVRVAGFDLDWTLVRPVHSLFPKKADDWAFLPNRLLTLNYYRDNGYQIAIFTNQKNISSEMNKRIRNIIHQLKNDGLNPWVFIATMDDDHRKPEVGMWNLLRQYIPHIDYSRSFYVGDAAGRLQDFSNSDSEFAQRIGINFYTPEEIFPEVNIQIPDDQAMYIMVGMPGAGKTSFYMDHLEPRGWVHITSDNKSTRFVEDALIAGKSVAIDATHPTIASRKKYIDLAAKYAIPTGILWFVRNGYEWNKLRPKPVPTVAYHVYFKHLQPPSIHTDRVVVIEVP